MFKDVEHHASFGALFGKSYRLNSSCTVVFFAVQGPGFAELRGQSPLREWTWSRQPITPLLSCAQAHFFAASIVQNVDGDSKVRLSLCWGANAPLMVLKVVFSRQSDWPAIKYTAPTLTFDTIWKKHLGNWDLQQETSTVLEMCASLFAEVADTLTFWMWEATTSPECRSQNASGNFTSHYRNLVVDWLIDGLIVVFDSCPLHLGTAENLVVDAQAGRLWEGCVCASIYCAGLPGRRIMDQERPREGGGIFGQVWVLLDVSFGLCEPEWCWFFLGNRQFISSPKTKAKTEQTVKLALSLTMVLVEQTMDQPLTCL